MFTAEAYFSQLFDDTSAFIRRFTKQYGGAARSAIVEVGCGTGEALIPHYDDAKPVKTFDERSRTLNTRCMSQLRHGISPSLRALQNVDRYLVGVDFNQAFVDFCNGNVPDSHKGKVRHLCGDAVQLDVVLRELRPAAWTDWDETVKVVTCVGNTIGIIPPEIKPAVYEQMARVAGRNGVAVMVYCPSQFRGTPDCNESAASHSYGLDAHCL